VITTATEEFRSALLERFAFLDPARVIAIPNGYDPDDFPPGPSRPPSDHFVLTYVGTVFHLTSARGLIAGLRRLQAREPELARGLEVRFIGRVVETEQVYFAETEELGVRLQGYLEHRQALAALKASHATLCLLDDEVGADRIYPAKIFELMYLQTPCLAITPTGALSRLVQLHGLGEVVHPSDTDGIANALARLLRAFRVGGVATQSQSLLPTLGINQFHRKAQAGQFAEVFRTAIGLARAKPPRSGDAQATAAQAMPPQAMDVQPRGAQSMTGGPTVLSSAAK
jgi:glycosyltransferase involved in cell wall biosynthesis